MAKAIHLLRSTRTVWCGRRVATIPTPGQVDREHITSIVSHATCKVCLKADAAETRRNA